MTPPPDPAPTILTYDAYTPAKDKRARWIIPGYCLGFAFASMLHVAYKIYHYRDESAQEILFDGAIPPLAFSAIAMVPTITSLGLAIWLKQKWFKEVRFASFRKALVWGFIGGLYPWSLFQELGTIGYWILLGAAIWYLLFPALAGNFLCYRSHLRE